MLKTIPTSKTDRNFLLALFIADVASFQIISLQKLFLPKIWSSMTLT